MGTIQIHTRQLHRGQAAIVAHPARFKAIRCGRRWGKTETLMGIAEHGAVIGEKIGIFAPQYKTLVETYAGIHDVLEPVIKTAAQGHMMRLLGGGAIDFWSLEDLNAGRGRKYHKVLIDEAAFTKSPQMKSTWANSIRATLMDYAGSAYALSTPFGKDPDNFFYDICTNSKSEFTDFHAPTHTNPTILPSEIELFQANMHPLSYAQEIQARFVDWAGNPLFDLSNPVPDPDRVDYVFAVIDSAVKSGIQHDGTAVTYFAVVNRFVQTPLVVLDWDIHQIEGASLINWIPEVFEHLNSLAEFTNARQGVSSTWIEDKASGSILLQQCADQGYDVQPIPGNLTAMGKDERAMSIVDAVWKHDVALSQFAYDKTVEFKGVTKNHLISQVQGYRIGDKLAYKRPDDLFDTFGYGVQLGLDIGLKQQ